MKKMVSLLVAASLGLSAFPSVFAASQFSDMDDPTAAWAVEYIDEMAELGFVTGYEDGTYQPHKSVTRHEVFALMARVLGCNADENKYVVAAAVEKYEPMLKLYSVTWGMEELSFLLQKGVITENDLKTYMSGNLKSEAMPRGEIAVIITKAIGAEKEAKEASYVLPYNDVNSINTTIRPYVGYVSEKGLMNGMEDGNFSPSTSVLRSQIAAILSRIHEKLDISKISGIIGEIDEESKSISYTDEDGEEIWITYEGDIDVTVDGETSQLSYVKKGLNAVLTFSGDNLTAIDVVDMGANETFSARYISKVTASNVTRITLKRFTEGAMSETLECAEGFSVEYQGSPSTLLNFKDGDYVDVVVRDGKIESIAGKPGNETIAGCVVQKIEIDPDFQMTISHSNPEYDGKTYTISEDAKVIKNTESVSLSDVYIGDTVTLGFTYGIITSVSAFSTNSNTEGTIKSITLSASPSMVITTNGRDNEYSIPNDVVIEVNGKEGTVYDFRVGDSVVITLESKAIKKIRTTSAQSSSGSVVGVVSNVNSSYGFIKVAYTNASGYTVEETVYCKDSTTNIMTSAGMTKKLKDIEVGSNVTAHGTISNGAFTAKVIVVTE